MTSTPIPATPDTGPDPAELASLAESVAVEAGELALRHRRTGIELAGTKSSRSDVVTAADLAVEQLIRDRIAAARPGDTVLGEEGGSQPGAAGTSSGSPAAAVSWVVDPIDGTVNYVYGIPAWSVSIAVAVGGQVMAGAVVNPMTGEVFTASAGGGASLNGAPLRRGGDVPDLAVALVGTVSATPRPTGRSTAGWSASCCRRCATSGVSGPRHWTCAWSPPGSWTPTTSAA